MLIRCAAIDPSMRNFGIAKVDIDLDDLSISVVDLKLISTESNIKKNKVVRKNSDDMRRAEEITVAMHDFVKDCQLVFGEIPSGGQSARAVFSFGLAIGVMSSLKVINKPLIQIQPVETKLAAVGTRVASKEEMIEWAAELYPNAPWLRAHNKPNGKPTLANEHLADAMGVAHAGVKSDEFQRLRAAWRLQSQAA